MKMVAVVQKRDTAFTEKDVCGIFRDANDAADYIKHYNDPGAFKIVEVNIVEMQEVSRRTIAVSDE